MAQLLPLSAPIGINSNYVRNQPTTLILRQKIFSLASDSGFNIEDEFGNPVINIQSKVLTLHNRKYINDLQGRQLFEIHESLIKIVPKFHFKTAGGQEVMTLKTHLTCKLKNREPLSQAGVGQCRH